EVRRADGFRPDLGVEITAVAGDSVTRDSVTRDAVAGDAVAGEAVTRNPIERDAVLQRHAIAGEAVFRRLARDGACEHHAQGGDGEVSDHRALLSYWGL